MFGHGLSDVIDAARKPNDNRAPTAFGQLVDGHPQQCRKRIRWSGSQFDHLPRLLHGYCTEGGADGHCTRTARHEARTSGSPVASTEAGRFQAQR